LPFAIAHTSFQTTSIHRLGADSKNTIGYAQT